MPELSKILMLVNWDVHRLNGAKDTLQSPNVLREGEKYWFFKYWPNQQVQVDVLDFCKVPLFNHVERWWLKFYVIQALRALPRLGKYDLIISHGAQSGVLLAFIRSILGRRMPHHLIIDVGCFNGGRNRKLELLPLRWASRSLAGVVSHNSFQRDYYLKSLPRLADRNLFVPFGTDPEFFKPLDLVEEDCIVSVGYIKRDWDTLLRAFEGLENGVRLKIVGVANKETLNLSSRIQDRVECMPYIPIQRLKREIARAKFMVIPLPYQKYSFGQMTLLQGMSMQKAVIVTDVPGVADYVRDGKNALLFGPKDWQELRRKMEMLLDRPALRLKLAQNARDTVVTEFSERNLALNLHRAVGQLCTSES
jgi:glycosyltransferase involved in cell wall biosynthesis